LQEDRESLEVEEHNMKHMDDLAYVAFTTVAAENYHLER
jgi:hypothetical protein